MKRPNKIYVLKGAILFISLLIFACLVLCFYCERTQPSYFPETFTTSGHWSKAPKKSIKTARKKSKEDLSRLMSLSYLQGYVIAPEERNVTAYDVQSAFNGLNLYISGHAPEAYLMNMQGNVLHQWHYDISRIWPVKPEGLYGGTYWRWVHLFENGDLLVLLGSGALGMIKIDKDSNLLWAYRGGCHHAFFIDNDNAIYVLTQKTRKINDTDSLLDNALTILTPDGKHVETLSFFDLLNKSPFDSVTREILKMAKKKNDFGVGLFKAKEGDVFHANGIYVFDGTFAHLSPLLKKNVAMVNLRTLGTIMFIDLKKKEIIALWGPGVWKRGQHEPAPLSNGNFLIFDNFCKGKQSCVTEFDPLTKKIIWQYAGGENDFFSPTQGLGQRLPNGNTLITESTSGRAFEVTTDKKIVWEFFNPHRTGKKNELIGTLFQMIRLRPNFPTDWLKEKPPQDAK